MINLYSLVPKIDHPVALWVKCLFVCYCYVNICCTWKFAKSFLIQKGSIFFLILKIFDVFWLQNLFHFFNAITIFARKPLKFFFLQEPIVSISHIAHKPVINYSLPKINRLVTINIRLIPFLQYQFGFPKEYKIFL